MTGTSTRRRRRALHWVGLGAITLVGGIAMAPLLPEGLPRRSVLSILLAYASLGALLLTLAVGPLNVLRRVPNPRSTDLRRDIGLWAAGTGAAHVVLSLGNHFDGVVRRYFFEGGAALPFRTDRFGLGAWTGALATIVLLGLAVISNDWSIRRLGRRWKQLQRWNYALAPLALAHTALFWLALRRTEVIWVPIAITAVTVALLQLAGVRATRGLVRPASAELGPHG